jgi:hypothetical protein
LSEEDVGRNRTRLLGRIIVVIIVLAVSIACVLAVSSLVDSGTATANIYVGEFNAANYGNISSPYVSVAGIVVNPSSLNAYNVSLLIDVYDEAPTAPVSPVASRNLDLGTLPGNSTKSFSTDINYSGGYFYDFEDGKYGFDYGLLIRSRFDFGIGFFAIALPIAVLLPTLDVYCAYRLGLFGWIRNRKRVVAATVAWTAAIALIVIMTFWSFYVTHRGIGISNILDLNPQLYLWEWVLIFLLSIVAGAIIADLGAAVYSFLATLILSTIFEFVYGSFFAWFGMGYSGSFSTIIPGMSFNAYLQSVLQDVFLTFLRMINVTVPCFCALGVFLGVIARSYFDPSVDV